MDEYEISAQRTAALRQRQHVSRLAAHPDCRDPDHPGCEQCEPPDDEQQDEQQEQNQ